jgi:hypothetical protein
VRVKRWQWGVMGAAAALVMVRAMLPWAVKSYVNRTLDRLPGYDGRVRDVDLHLWRGAYQIEGVEIVKEEGDVPLPFFSADRVDLSVAWRSLLRGAWVGEVALQAPRVNVALGRKEKSGNEASGAGAQTGTEGGAAGHWTDAAKRLFPLKIDRLTVEEGRVHLVDLHRDPPMDVFVGGLRLEARNLTNSEKLSKDLMASVTAFGRPMARGTLYVHLDLDPYRREPTFNLDLAATGVDVTLLNGLLRRQAGIDVESGRLDLFVEMASADGAFKGYVKPLLRDLDVTSGEEPKRTLGETLKELLADVAAALLQNRREETVATRVEFSGRYGDARVGAWAAVLASLRHAFIRALVPALERSVGLEDVRGARR